MDYSVITPIMEKVINKKMTQYRKKKNIFVVDGLFHHKINMKTLQCDCLLKKGPCPCIHLMLVLSSFIKFDDLPIVLIPEMMGKIKIELNTTNSKDNISVLIKKEYNKLECSICMDPFLCSRLEQCSKCFNMFHKSCSIKWQKIGKSGCSNCRANKLIVTLNI
jgi:hypothetical protein